MNGVKLLLISVLIFAMNINSSAQVVFVGDSVFTIDKLYDENIPLLIISTNDKEEPSYDEISAPEGLWGEGITNANYVPGSMKILRGNKSIYESGEYVKKESGITIKVRGNTSAYNKKKPYKIKLQKKSDLLFRGNDDFYKDKDWILIYSGGLSTKTKVGLMVNKQMGLQWTPSYEYVNVVMNDIYRGMYLLMEAVEMTESRLSVDENTGYVIEYDAYWWKEDVYVESNYSKYVNYTFKYPDTDDITQDQIQYIKTEIDKMEASLEDATYTEYIDVKSFANWLLGHDLLGTWDSGGSNMFLTKNDNTENSKFIMGNMWDFDMIERVAVNEWSNIHNDANAFYYPKLLNSNDKTFITTYVERWNEISDTIVNNIVNELDEFANSSLAESIDKYYHIDSIASLWSSRSVKEEVNSHKQWFYDRKQWLDKAINDLNISSSIDYINNDNNINSNITYNIYGQKVYKNYKGLIILNGKKYMKR